ncbi:Aldedh-domain-containing protein [Tricholoma matsutake]|nr:Aldedh-domain-containing protein [Tricholoma matsutake 945]
MINPTNNKVIITQVSEVTSKDVDAAVLAAQKAFETTWGLNTSSHKDELAAIKSLDNRKPFGYAFGVDVTFTIDTIKYYAGWADKVMGQLIETDERKWVYTQQEPIGVVGQILPWNFPCCMFVPGYYQAMAALMVFNSDAVVVEDWPWYALPLSC